MAWIESHTVLRTHRKVLKLSRELRLNTAQTIGHLHLLWYAALDQRENGDLANWSDELIAELAGYTGDAHQFVRLLQDVGWLDDKVIHDWWSFSKRYLKRKYSRTPEKWQAIKAIYEKKAPGDHLVITSSTPKVITKEKKEKEEKEKKERSKEKKEKEVKRNKRKAAGEEKISPAAPFSFSFEEKGNVKNKDNSLELLSYFGEKFKEKTGYTYPATFKKDITLLKDILRSQGGDKTVILDLMDIFFERATNSTEWHADKLTIGVFKVKLPELLITLSECKKKWEAYNANLQKIKPDKV